MKRYFFIVAAFVLLIVSGCSDDVVTPSHPSYRDGTFTGDNLSVTLNGTPVQSVTAVTMESQLFSSNVDDDREPGVVGSSNPIYMSVIVVNGFPSAGRTTVLSSMTDLMGFQGSVTVDGMTYRYVGEFLGDPLSLHSKQGLNLSFTLL